MNSKTQCGFSVIEALVIIVIIGLIGGSLLLVSLKHQAKNGTPTGKSGHSSTAGQQPVTPAGNDYHTYSNAALGFSFAYPNDWGALTVATDTTTAPASGATPDVKDAKKYPYHHGKLTFSIDTKASFQIAGQKYGATYVPVLKNSSDTSYAWKVVAVNPADITDHMGDIYNAPVVTSNSGVQLYDFNFSDEGSNTKRWVFETKAGFVTLSLPAFGSDTGSPTAAAMAAQQSIANTISKSIQLIY